MPLVIVTVSRNNAPVEVVAICSKVCVTDSPGSALRNVLEVKLETLGPEALLLVPVEDGLTPMPLLPID